MNGISANLPKRPMGILQAFISYFRTTINQTDHLFLELNSVKLMGTIVDDIQYLKGGAIKLRIKTVTEDTGE